MPDSTAQPPISTSILPATREQEPILSNLLELYIHDFSEILHLDLGPDGRFGYNNLSHYWTQPDHHPFLITVDDQLAGFAFVKKATALAGDDDSSQQQVWDMAEFFVVRAHRKRGLGLSATHQLWQLFPGPWQVRVMDKNLPALHFWQRAIDTFTGKSIAPALIDRDEKRWAVFTFQS
jgi:predicted acetyltransferase